MNNLEQVLQVISIIVFISGGITFFFKTGSYKTTIDKDIKALQDDIKELKDENEDIKDDIEKMKSENSKVIANLDKTLTEIKTKLELLIQFSGWNSRIDERDKN